MSFESIVNAVIPWFIGIIGVFILYRPLKEPLAPLFAWIGRTIRWIFGERDESIADQIRSIQYE